MLTFFKNIWTDVSVRNKVAFILLVLVIYRIGAHITVPGIDKTALENIMGSGSFGLMDTFSGGALQNYSIFALGVMPYITASIVIQLLSHDVVPKLTEWNEQGDFGRKKIKKLTFILAFFVALFQSFGMTYGFNNISQGFGSLVENETFLNYALISLILTAGSMFLMYLGEKITKNGIGNGLSILIFAGIISTFPMMFYQIWTLYFKPEQMFLSIVILALFVIALLLIIVFAVYILEAYRRIPIQYNTKNKNVEETSTVLGVHVAPKQRLLNNKMQSHLPIKLNTAGVIPVIFAVAFLMVPTTIVSFFEVNKFTTWVSNNLTYYHPIGMILYALLIFAFAYFYAFIQLDPKKMSENLAKSGGYVPTIEPGEKTKKYLTGILKRLTFVGATFLVIISLIPLIGTSALSLPQSVQIGGVSVLIIIGVSLDTFKQLQSNTAKSNYKKYKKR